MKEQTIRIRYINITYMHGYVVDPVCCNLQIFVALKIQYVLNRCGRKEAMSV